MPDQDRYKWVALGITSLGVLMTAIDTTVVILALPNILSGLHSNLVRMIWVPMGYILASTVLLLALGRVADIYGRVRLYNLGFATFTLGSALCGLSWNDTALIGFRVLQGIGGALLVVNSLAIITEAFPPAERGTAMGYNSITFSTGSAIATCTTSEGGRPASTWTSSAPRCSAPVCSASRRPPCPSSAAANEEAR